METEQCDAISRTLGSRRHALGAAIGGVAMLGRREASQAKKKRKKKKCKPKAGTCTCKAGEQCYVNGSCGQVCHPSPSLTCPVGCVCGSGADVQCTCFANLERNCTNAPVACAGNTADCPKGTVCRNVNCPEGPGGRCVPLCTA